MWRLVSPSWYKQSYETVVVVVVSKRYSVRHVCLKLKYLAQFDYVTHHSEVNCADRSSCRVDCADDTKKCSLV